MSALLEVDDLRVEFATRHGRLRAVDGVSFSIQAGETLGLVGESGCGKSTVARAILGLVRITGGAIRFDGRDITRLAGAARRPLTRAIQIVFQDPFASLNPRKTVGALIAEPLIVHSVGTADERLARVESLLRMVGLPRDAMQRFPHAFSGGQRQRIGIARALALSPRLLVLDEPVSALDLSVQAQILNLLADLQSELHLSCLFISHDLAVVRHVAQRTAVMYLGRIAETAQTQALFDAPAHPYAEALVSTVANDELVGAPAIEPLAGDVPSPLMVPAGCRFHPRCPRAGADCGSVEPLERSVAAFRTVACHYPAGPPHNAVGLPPVALPPG